MEYKEGARRNEKTVDPPYSFRWPQHTFATRYIEKGEVVTLKDILGKIIEMTLRYAYVTIDKKRWCVEMLNVTLDGHYMDTKPQMADLPISATY